MIRSSSVPLTQTLSCLLWFKPGEHVRPSAKAEGFGQWDFVPTGKRNRTRAVHSFERFFESLNDNVPHDVVWDHVSLFGKLPKNLLWQVYIDMRNVKRVSPVSRESTLEDLCYEYRVAIFYRLWWWKLLAQGTKRRVRNLLLSDKGVFRLQQICCTVDGLITSMWLADTSVFRGRTGNLCTLVRWCFTHCLFNGDKFESHLKGFKKDARKFLLADPVPHTAHAGLNDIGLKARPFGINRLFKFIHRLQAKYTRGSQALIFHGLNFCQTRNQGQATYDAEVKAASKLVTIYQMGNGNVDVQEIEHLVEVTYDHLSRTDIVHTRARAAAKISANSNSCIQSTRKQGGKIVAVADIYNSVVGKQFRVDLHTGEKTATLADGIGPVVFHYC